MAYRSEQDAAQARRLVDEARARVRGSILDHVRTAKPCAASWDDMEGDDQVRHCSGCDKDVFHLSHMTREDAERLVAATNGKLCARYYRRADGTILTADCPVGVRDARRRKLVVAGTTVMIAAAGWLAYERTAATAAAPDAPAAMVAAAAEDLVPSVRAQGVDVDPPALVDHHVPHDHMAPQYHAPPQVRRGNVAQHTAPVEPPLDLQPWQGDVDLSSLGQ
jgi:hypothetical protein